MTHTYDVARAYYGEQLIPFGIPTYIYMSYWCREARSALGLQLMNQWDAQMLLPVGWE